MQYICIKYVYIHCTCAYIQHIQSTFAKIRKFILAYSLANCLSSYFTTGHKIIYDFFNGLFICFIFVRPFREFGLGMRYNAQVFFSLFQTRTLPVQKYCSYRYVFLELVPFCSFFVKKNLTKIKSSNRAWLSTIFIIIYIYNPANSRKSHI